MPPFLAGFVAKARPTLAAISLGQKVVIGLLVVGLGLGAVFFTTWVTKPTMSPLFTNLASSDASAITEQLTSDGVEYELDDGGATILVAQDKVAAERLAASAAGLPASADTGYSLLDEQGITTSEFQQQTTYKRAIEGELQTTLKALDGVQSARVQIAMPQEDVFATDEATATASVLLQLAPGTTLSGEQVQAVTHLVSSSVEGMDSDDVTVADQSGAVLSTAGSGVTAAATDQQISQEQAYEANLAAKAQTILDRVVGSSNAQVAVRADLDFSQTDSTSDVYSSTPGVSAAASSGSTETYSGTGSNAAGVLGAEDTTTSTTGSDGDYNKTSTTDNNPINKTTTNTTKAPGAVDRLTVSVVMNSAKAGSLNQNTLQSLISNAVGLDTTRGDTITVASLPFDTTAADAAAASLAEEAKAEKSAQLMQTIKTGGIAAAIGLVVLLAWLRSRRNRVVEYEELEDDAPLPLDTLQVQSVRDPVVDDQQARLAAAQREKVRGEISSMVSDRPDEVATMLRGWFAEAR